MTTGGYYSVIMLSREGDITPDLKRIIIIFLLLIMAGQATGIFYSKSPELKLVQELDDKNEHETKEDKKEGKEFISDSLSFHRKLINKIDFNLTQVIIISSPVIDHLTPPPDRASGY